MLTSLSYSLVNGLFPTLCSLRESIVQTVPWLSRLMLHWAAPEAHGHRDQHGSGGSRKAQVAADGAVGLSMSILVRL